ncbi:MAG: YihY/virulence factor BrkB family protein [bacterium]|nr:MAG: YihY/virulence factor BrkB family protein [bacterium]
MLRLLKDTYRGFIEDEGIMMSAAVAFYAALSMAPLLLVLIWVAGLIGEPAQQRLIDQVQLLVGLRAMNVVEVIVENAVERQYTGSISTVLGLVLLLFASTAVFSHLHRSMNRIWNVTMKPGRGLLNWVLGRLLSLAMVGFVGLLLFISFIASTAATIMLSANSAWWRLFEHAISFFIFMLLFGALFKILPAVRIPWRHTFIGSAITAFLFEIGTYGFSTYLRLSTIGSVYGAAGSLLILLLWIYYSSVIVFFGMESIWAYTRMRGSPPELRAYAQLKD